MDYILETSQLTKVFGKQKALDNVSVHVRKGDIYGLIGRNGAGKTTLLKIISGLSSASDGSFSIFGKAPSEMKKIVSRLGTLIESPGFYPNMTAKENLAIKCIAMGIRDKNKPDELLKTVGLTSTGRKPVGKFSLGMKQRLGMALALVGSPDIVILDEPINGLDPEGIIEVRDMISTLNREQGITFIISSHILEELSKIATVYGIINDGRLVQEINTEELNTRCGERLELTTANTADSCTVLEKLGIYEYKVLDGGVISIAKQLDRAGDITMALAGAGIPTLSIGIKNESLEKYYINLIGGNGGAHNA